MARVDRAPLGSYMASRTELPQSFCRRNVVYYSSHFAGLQVYPCPRIAARESSGPPTDSARRGHFDFSLHGLLLCYNDLSVTIETAWFSIFALRRIARTPIFHLSTTLSLGVSERRSSTFSLHDGYDKSSGGYASLCASTLRARLMQHYD